MGVSEDISVRKRDERRLRLMLRELSHRVKNTLAMVQAVADQTSRSSRTFDDFRLAFRGRIAALARLHAPLIESATEAVELRLLVESMLDPYDGSSKSAAIAGEPVAVGRDAVVPLGMTFHELVTNSIKCGALSVPGGRVDIGWRVEDCVSKRRVLHLDWVESDGPSVVEPVQRGFGMTLIEQTITYELAGAVELSFARAGVRCEMTIPFSGESL